MSKIGRNDPCPCGSGKKYKKCCLQKDLAASAPKVMTASGEEASFRQARYDLLDRDKVLELLSQTPDFDAEISGQDQASEVSFAWLETGESARLMKTIKGIKHPANSLLGSSGEDGPLRLLGDIKIKGGKLLFNAMGDQRFRLGKQRLESLLAGLIRHRLDSVQSLASAMAAHDQSSRAPLPLDRIDQAFDPHDPKFAPLKPGESLEDALRERDFQSIDEVNAFAERAADDYNQRPQPEMGGLSPLQVGHLLRCDWSDPLGPVRVNQDLSRDDLKGKSSLLTLAHLLLVSCEELGGIKATQAGYLNTTYVLSMAAQILAEEEIEQEAFMAEMKGRIKETDFFPLYLARSVCQFADFIKLKNGRFRLTAQGRLMLDTQNAGSFYARLFLTRFREMDLDAMDPTGEEYPAIQHTLAFSLYALGRMDPARWYNPSDFYPAVLLPAAKQEVGGSEETGDWSEDDWWCVIDAMDCRFIDPLRELGLIEEREMEQAQSEVDTFQLRPTPLFRKFISFDI